MRYSKDFKECAVSCKRDNHTYEEGRSIFKIAKSTLYNCEKEYSAGFPDKPKRTCEKKMKKEALKERSDSELAEPFKCSAQAIFYALKRVLSCFEWGV
ncbi:MAG: transposase [Oscillospiraceae bacterium]|jgi:transposase-like protein|nr:transposase [Oscillospiraceae bacterium]